MKSLIVLAGVFALSLSGTANAELFQDARLSSAELALLRGGVDNDLSNLSGSNVGGNGNYGVANSGTNNVGLSNGSGSVSSSNGTSGSFNTGIYNGLVGNATSYASNIGQ